MQFARLSFCNTTALTTSKWGVGGRGGGGGGGGLKTDLNWLKFVKCFNSFVQDCSMADFVQLLSAVGYHSIRELKSNLQPSNKNSVVTEKIDII